MDKEKITFDEAKAGLQHLQKRRNGQSVERPPLTKLNGWERAKKINGIKHAIRDAFKNEIDKEEDYQQQLQEIQQSETPDDVKREKINEIDKAYRKMADQERVVKFPDGKLTKDDIPDSAINQEILDDLGFAIDLTENDEE